MVHVVTQHQRTNSAKSVVRGQMQAFVSALSKYCSVVRVTYDELSTLNVEVESILKSRLLTYVYPDDVEEPLTPSQLMTKCRLTSIPDDKVVLEDNEKDDHGIFSRRERYLATLLGHF